jgi:hypothetical protein
MADKIEMTKFTGTKNHPLGNLGGFAHPTKGRVKTGDFPDHRPKSVEKKKVLRDTPAPQVHGRNSQDYSDFKPSPKPGKNTRMKEKQVAGQLQNGGANANLASFQNPSYDTAPFAERAQPVVKQSKPKVRRAVNSGVPFYGNV